jgi:amiloride-sensitive sodium channel
LNRCLLQFIFTILDQFNQFFFQRQCLFDEERPTKFNGVYSQSDCNVDCRIASTLALCQCIPFMIPLSTTDSVCTLNNLACLHQYRSTKFTKIHLSRNSFDIFPDKWNFLYPEQDDLGLLQREQHDSLRCSHTCYPSCDATLYDVVSERAIIHKHKSRNHTVVHIYYYNRFSNLYKHDVVYYWFEILSMYEYLYSTRIFYYSWVHTFR